MLRLVMDYDINSRHLSISYVDDVTSHTEKKWFCYGNKIRDKK